MPWYWPDVDNPQSAKLARVNAVGVSAVYGFLNLGFAQLTSPIVPRWPAHNWISAVSAVAFFGIAVGIYWMSRSASVTGLIWCSRICIIQIPPLIVALVFRHHFRAIVGIALDILFLMFYISAVRATFAYHRALSETSSERPIASN